MNWTEEQLIRVARRINNPRRGYLLVNPLQGKHLAVSPARALELMHALGMQVRDEAPKACAVVGFAETATAIGAVVASHFGPDCLYMQTTRERDRDGGQGARWTDFSEEHSHAQTQWLQAETLGQVIRRDDPVVFVDDEITTGKTCLNLVRALRRETGGAPRRVLLASLISRLSAGDRSRLQSEGIMCTSLVRRSCSGDEQLVTPVCVQKAAQPPKCSLPIICTEKLHPLPDPRLGVQVRSYEDAVAAFCTKAQQQLTEPGVLRPGRRITVLGTEECMYPAIRLGELLERQGLTVLTHSSTRSPIGISTEPGYPIREGYRVASFYEAGRDTYLYNPAACEATVVVTDAGGELTRAAEDVARVCRAAGAESLTLLQI